MADIIPLHPELHPNPFYVIRWNSGYLSSVQANGGFRNNTQSLANAAAAYAAIATVKQDSQYCDLTLRNVEDITSPATFTEEVLG